MSDPLDWQGHLHSGISSSASIRSLYHEDENSNPYDRPQAQQWPPHNAGDGYVDSYSSSSTSSRSFAQDKFSFADYFLQNKAIASIWIATLLLFLVASTLIVLKWFCRTRYGLTCCWYHDSPGFFHRDPAISDAGRRRAAAAEARRREEAEAEALERRDRTLAAVTMIVEERHLVREDDDDDGLNALESGMRDEEDGREDHGDDNATSFVLRIPGVRREAPGSCPICLGEYEVGEEVVWSPNVDCCQSAFHKECILGWLEGDNKECPYCRETFLPEEEEADPTKSPDEKDERRDASAPTVPIPPPPLPPRTDDPERDGESEGYGEHPLGHGSARSAPPAA